MKDDNKKVVRFAAINKYLDEVIASPTENTIRGKDAITWGSDNRYPDYLLSLYENVATLKSIINGCVDYIIGNDVTAKRNLYGNAINRQGETIREIVRKCAFDYKTYGGFALNPIRSKDGKSISEIYHVDMRYLRSNKKNDVFYYSEEWNKGYMKKDKVIVLPKFTPIGTEGYPSSILFVKNTYTQVYPSPEYGAAIKACELEKRIDDFHLNAIANGFTADVIVNFNNGTPSEEIMDEIEDNFNEKFSGSENAGRIVFSWNANKENATTIENIDVTDFGVKYDSLAKRARQQIFTSFRANPNLFGIPTDNLGFSSEEYKESFDLFNRTQIQPVQALIIDAFDKIFGEKDSITIIPFSLPEENKEV